MSEPWPLEPDEEESAGLRETLVVFAKGLAGGAITLIGLGMVVVPNLIEARGATRSWVLDKARRQRALELGLTLEQLEALEGHVAPAPGEPPAEPR